MNTSKNGVASKNQKFVLKQFFMGVGFIVCPLISPTTGVSASYSLKHLKIQTSNLKFFEQENINITFYMNSSIKGPKHYAAGYFIFKQYYSFLA